MSGEAHGHLRVELLGPVRAWIGTRELGLGAPMQRAVFTALALRANHAVTRSELVDALWGQDAPPRAESAVYTYVSGLRRALQPASTRRMPGELLASGTAGYVLRLQRGRLDAALFERYLSQARQLRASRDMAGMTESVDAAFELWRGTPLSGIPGPFADIERTRLSEIRLCAIEERAEAMLELGRHAEVAAELPAVVREHPFRERLCSLLVLALYRGGRQADALAVFSDVRRTLAEELGIEPSRDLKRLHEQVLSGDQALDPPPATVTGSTLARRGPQPAQLPHDVAGFTGRGAELAQLRALLATGDEEQPGRRTVIVVIDGTAGIGKTAAAVHFAHQVAGRFPDGQLFVDLRGFDPSEPELSPGKALEHLLLALQIDPRHIPYDAADRAGMYRSVLSGKRALVILDNAASADQVRPLLPGGAACAVVITSRNRLSSLVARDGAHRVTLGVLPAPKAADLIARIVGPRRLDREPGAAAELARLCGRLPLALRIAAERVAARPHLSLAELARRLAVEHDRLDLLATGDEAAAVRAVLSWSYRAMPPEPAHMFRLLALHTGTDVSAPAAAALTGTDTARARRLLDALADAHLLEESGTDRFRFHDLVRVYAGERAAQQDAPGDRDAAVRRLLCWYLHTADAADSIIDPRRPRVPLGAPDKAITPLTFADHDEALRWCEDERANLLAATRHAAAIGAHTTAWQLPMALHGFFSLRTLWNDWIPANQIGLSSARRIEDSFAEAAILTSLGIAYYEIRRFTDAIDGLQQALCIWHAIGFPQAEAITLDSLGAAFRDTGRFGEALGHLQRALPLWQDAADRWGEAITLHNLGDTYRHLGRFGEAIDLLQRSRSVRGEIGDEWGLAWTLHDLGSTYADLQRYDAAIGCYRQALAIRRKIGDRHGEARTLRRLGQVYGYTGRPEMAARSLRRARDIFEDLGDPRAAQIGDCLGGA